METVIRQLNLKHAQEARQLYDVQIPAYRVEAALIGCDDIPPLRETVESLQACTETVYGYWSENGTLAAAIAYEIVENSTLDITRVMVHPDFFRRGIAGALLQFVETLEPDVTRLIVTTGARNEPAIRLYERHGFTRLADFEVEPGLWMASFEKWIVSGV